MKLEDNAKVLTREELYNLVWSKPMIELAKELGYSDNGLRKVCRRHKIPIPKVGYWQKLKFGKKVQKAELPEYEGENKVVIHSGLIKGSKFPEKFTDTIPVPEHIEKYHSLIVKAQKLFKKNHTYHGRLYPGREGLDICVSSEQIERACRIMDTIIKALEQEGVKVEIGYIDEWKSFTFAGIDGEKIHFSLEESLKIMKIEKKNSFDSGQEFVPNGKLKLCIKDDYIPNCRTKWSDGEHGKLEEKLASFVNGLWVAAASIKQQREEREKERRKWEEDRKEREQKLLALEEEKRKQQVLDQQVASWQKSRSIRALIRTVVRKKGAYTPESELGKWVEWASKYASELDPIKI